MVLPDPSDALACTRTVLVPANTSLQNRIYPGVYTALHWPLGTAIDTQLGSANPV